jgi:transposase-like protein
MAVGTALLSEVKLSEYCREKGLYPDQVKAWKQACIIGQQAATQQKQIAGAQARADQKRIRELERELRRKGKTIINRLHKSQDDTLLL